MLDKTPTIPLIQRILTDKGEQLCTNVLTREAYELAGAVADSDMKAALAMLHDRAPGLITPMTRYLITRLEHLCLAASAEMCANATLLTYEIPHPVAAQIAHHLAVDDVRGAANRLHVTRGFKYNPSAHDLEYGWEPEPGYTEIANETPDEYRDELAQLAYLVARLPEKTFRET